MTTIRGDVWNFLGELKFHVVKIDHEHGEVEFREGTLQSDIDQINAIIGGLPAAPTVQIPQSVSRFQARAALHLAGMLEAVETMIALPETPVLAKLAWADAQEFKRNSPTVLSLSASLGLTEAQLDALFTTAAGIDA